MGGETMIGIGLSALAASAPITVAVAKLMRSRYPNGTPGRSQECIAHGARLTAVETAFAGHVGGVTKALNAIDHRLERIENKLYE